MNKLLIYILSFILLSAFSGCSAIEGIFKAGVWVGVLGVVVVVALIIWLATRSKK